MAFNPYADNGHDRFASHRAPSQYLPRPKQPLRSIYDAPPKLVLDAEVRTIFGDSAYFRNGEYRKPDTRTIYIEGLERMYQNTFQSTFELLPKEAIEHHIKGAEKYWDKFLDEHNELYNRCDTVEEMETHRVVHRNTQRLNENLMTKLLQQLAAVNREERDRERRTSTTFGRSQDDHRSLLNEVKFEKIKINPFDGRPQKWPQFKRIFETYFHNTGASNSAKIVHLLNHLEGEPLNLISGFDPRGENYEIAWKTICDAYDDERSILDAMIKTFLDIPKVQSPTRAALMNLVTSTKNLIEPMTTYEVSTESWGVWIVPILTRKLDSASFSEWCMERPRRVKPDVGTLLDFIANRAEGVEELPHAQNNFRNGQQTSSNNGRAQIRKFIKYGWRTNTQESEVSRSTLHNKQ